VPAVLTAASLPSLPGTFAARATQALREPTPFVKKVTAASAAGVLALGLLALPFANGDDDRVGGLTDGDRSSVEVPSTPEVPFTNIGNLPAGAYTGTPSGTGLTRPSTRTSFRAPATGTRPAPAKKTTPTKPAPKPQEQPKPEPGLLAPVCDTAGLLCDVEAPAPVNDLPAPIADVLAPIAESLADLGLDLEPVPTTSPSVPVALDDEPAVPLL
jgi:hypothetical protein